jgi:hypothetical protein
MLTRNAAAPMGIALIWLHLCRNIAATRRQAFSAQHAAA